MILIVGYFWWLWVKYHTYWKMLPSLINRGEKKSYHYLHLVRFYTCNECQILVRICFTLGLIFSTAHYTSSATNKQFHCWLISRLFLGFIKNSSKMLITVSWTQSDVPQITSFITNNSPKTQRPFMCHHKWQKKKRLNDYENCRQ